jgi:hypothetical protein
LIDVGPQVSGFRDHPRPFNAIASASLFIPSIAPAFATFASAAAPPRWLPVRIDAGVPAGDLVRVAGTPDCLYPVGGGDGRGRPVYA